MSLFEDKKLVAELIRIAMPKTAQEAPKAIDPNAIKSLAGKLISNLEKSANLTTDKTDSALYMKDLQNLDNLIFFLKSENMQYNGKLIVVNTLELDEKPDQYAQYVLKTGFDALPANTTVWIYKDGLINYLHSIQSQPDTDQGKLINAMVGKLIDEANKELNLNIDKSAPQAQVKQIPTLPDNTPLDSIYDTVIYESPLQPPQFKGSITITPANLKSKSAFDDFVRKISLKKGNQTIKYDDDSFTDASFCDILYVLHTRAKSYAYRRGEENALTYLKMIEDLAGQYQCSIEGREDGIANKQVSYSPSESRSVKLSPQQAKAIQSMGMNMPLLGDRIDFNRISTWLNYFTRINQDPTVSAGINNALQIIQNIKAKYRVNSQPLAQEAVGIVNVIMSNTQGDAATKSAAPVAYLGQLQSLISLVGGVLSSFKSAYYDSLPQDDEEFKNAVDTQIGASGSSFYNINDEKIQTWLSDLPSALHQVENRGFGR